MPRFGVYTLLINALDDVTNAPIFQISTPSTMAVEIMELRLGQESSVTSEEAAFTLTRRSTASTLPTATTPVALAQREAASLLTGSTTTNATGVATVTGTLVSTTHIFAFNHITGLLWLPPEAGRITIQPSSFLTGQFVAAPTVNDNWSGYVTFRELF